MAYEVSKEVAIAWTKSELKMRDYDGHPAHDDTAIPIPLGVLRALAEATYGDEERFQKMLAKETLGGTFSTAKPLSEVV